MIRSQPAIPERVPVLTFPTPRGKADLVFFERRDSRLSKNQSWCYGDEHPNKREYPDHELVLVSPDDGDPAWQRWYYAAVREKQHLYNWTATDEPDWPALTQVFFVKRCSLPVDEDSLLPPPVEFVDTTDYLVTGTEIGRAGDDLLESLYVTVKLTREHLLNNPKVSYVLDAQTNTLRPVVEEKIPASQAEAEASTVDANGQYSEVRAATSRWAIKTTQFMEGLAGGVAGGGHVQEWTDVLNYSWPYVFRGCSFNVFPSSSGGIAKLTVTPRWLRERYDGPCEATIREEWTFTEPTPPILQPMLTTGMEFNGGLLQVNIPPCLHPFWYFIDSPGTDHPEFGYYQYYEEYPATTLEDWPEEHIASFTVRPAMGGYISRTVTVKRPSGGVVFANLVTLLVPVVGATAGTVNLSWTHENLYGTLVRYKLSVNRKADFTGTYLTGFNNKNVGTATTATVTGLQIGIIYFARVDAYVLIDDEEQMVSSNVQALLTPATPAYRLLVDGEPVADGETLDFGSISVLSISPAVKQVAIENTGNVAITGSALAISGTDAAFWTAVFVSGATLTPGQQRVFDLEFSPTVARSYSATLTLQSDNAPEKVYSLVGAAGTPLPEFELDSSPVSSGDAASFDGIGGSSSTPAIRVLQVTNNASATADLVISGWQFTGVGASAWTPDITFFDPVVVAPGDSTTLALQFSPPSADSYSATFELIHDGGGSPFTLEVSGEALMATLTGLPSSIIITAGLSVPKYVDVDFMAESPTSNFLTDFQCSSVSVSGPNSSLFSTSYSSGFTLPASQELTPDLTLTFAGTSVDGVYSAYLDFYHSHPTVSSPISVPITAYVSSSY
jgi:hypothetical protein